MVTQWNTLHNLQGSKKTLGLENKMIFLLESHPHAPCARLDTYAVYRILLETSGLWRSSHREVCVSQQCANHFSYLIISYKYTFGCSLTFLKGETQHGAFILSAKYFFRSCLFLCCYTWGGSSWLHEERESSIHIKMLRNIKSASHV